MITLVRLLAVRVSLVFITQIDCHFIRDGIEFRISIDSWATKCALSNFSSGAFDLLFFLCFLSSFLRLGELLSRLVACELDFEYLQRDCDFLWSQPIKNQDL